jgi:hypothetical protein
MRRLWYARRRRVSRADKDLCSGCCTCGYLVVSMKCLDPYSTRFRPEKSACHFSNALALELGSDSPTSSSQSFPWACTPPQRNPLT